MQTLLRGYVVRASREMMGTSASLANQYKRVWDIINPFKTKEFFYDRMPPEIVAEMPQPIRDLIEIVHGQLPAQLKKELSVNVEADAFQLRAKAIFTTKDKREYVTLLEGEMFEGVPIRCKIPEEFLAQLCAIV